jgi:hypothetical protein
MVKKWMGVALLVGWLATPATAQYLPTNVGAARMPEPVPCAPTGLVPGPITPQMAPPGPPDCLSLPEGHSSAFQCEEFAVHNFCYFHIGTQSLERGSLGNGTVAFLEQSGVPLDNGQRPLLPLAMQPLLTFGDLEPAQAYGVKGAIGYLFDNYGIELSGFYIPEKNANSSVVRPGLVNVFLDNPPLGFEGNNDIGLQADSALISLRTKLYNGEVNVRYCNKAVTHVEPIIGVRYMDVDERFALTVFDDSVSFRDNFGRFDVTRVATLSTRVHTRFVGPQAGFECSGNILPGVVLGLNGKGALGASFNDVDVNLRRGDGFEGSRNSRNTTRFSQVYEAGAFLDLYLLERFRFRGGYQALCIVGVPEAVDQINFDLSVPQGRVDNTGTIFFHGPTLEFQFLF